MAKSIKGQVEILVKQNRMLTENLVDAIWVMDADTLKYEYITPSVYAFSGYTAEELVNTSIMDRLSPASSKLVSDILIQGIERFLGEKQQAVQTLELELTHKNGTTYWVEVRGRLYRESVNKIKIVGVSREITARKNAERQLEDMNKALVEALVEKERLLKEIKVLQGMLPICSGCRRIRDDNNKWWPLDAYVRHKTNSDFTHTICPDCTEVFYPEYQEQKG